MADVYNPFVYWGQSKEKIFVKIDITDISLGPEVHIEEDKLTFRAQGLGARGVNTYEFSINFYLQIDHKNSKYRVTGRYVEVECKKVGLGEIWPRLIEEDKKPAWLKIDFDRFAFNDSDASSNEDQGGGAGEKVTKKLEKELFKAESNGQPSSFLPSYRDLLKLYLFLYNLFQWVGFCYVIGVISYRYWRDGPESRPGTFKVVGPTLMVCQIAAVLEVIHPLLRWVKTGVLMPFIQVFGRGLILFALISPEPRLHNREIVWWLFVAWSSVELFRYPFYMLSTMNKDWGLVTWLRYTVWIPLYPLGFFCEGYLMLQALPMIHQTRRWSIELPNIANCSFNFTFCLQVYMLCLLPGMYYLMTGMYYQRKRKLGPVSSSRRKPTRSLAATKVKSS